MEKTKKEKVKEPAHPGKERRQPRGSRIGRPVCEGQAGHKGETDGG